MKKGNQGGCRKLYKGKYFLTFYDKTDEEVLHIFDNVRDILKYLNKAITSSNINLMNVELYRALTSIEHFTRILGQTMRVYMIPVDEEQDVADE